MPRRNSLEPGRARPIVAVTDGQYRKAESIFAGEAGLQCVCVPSEEEALARAIGDTGAAHAVVGSERYTGPLYDALPRGGVLARFGVGHDGIDKAKATSAGLLCTNTPGVLDLSVAETTIMLLLASARRLPRLLEAVRHGAWTTPAGRELAGKTLAIIGCGRIGCAVARIAAFGFGMRVTGCEIQVDRAPALRSEFGIQTLTPDFAEAVSGADFVSLHIPATADTARFLNRERLALLSPHAWIINTARGAVVDENALYDSLASHQIGGAALDVFEREPYEPLDPARDLRRLDNVILTPHIGSHTTEANFRMAERAIRNIELAEAGEWTSMDLLNPEVLRTLA
jgi:phosphoglycerate dehydrogenase-like enzyme